MCTLKSILRSFFSHARSQYGLFSALEEVRQDGKEKKGDVP